MTPNRIAVAMEKYQKHIPQDCIPMFLKHLQEAKNDCLDAFMYIPIKSKTAAILFSIFLGGLGVDRFYVGEVAAGLIKIGINILSNILSVLPVVSLLLRIVYLIISIVDIFSVYKRVKEQNYRKLTHFLSRHRKSC